MRSIGFAKIGLLLLLAFTGGVGAGYARWKTPPTNNKVYRLLVIEEQAEQMAPGGTLVLGDSLVERQRLGSICGDTLNAGIGSSTTAEFLHLAARLAAKARPTRIIVNLGVNDVAAGVPADEIKRNISTILDALPAQTHRIVVGIPNDADNVLADAARNRGALYMPYPVPRELTHDGLHLTPEGAALWQSAVRSALCPHYDQLTAL